jgi:hypothetical protein
MLQPKQKLTLIKISETLALTGRYEIEVRTFLDGQSVNGRYRVATVRYRGKRKEWYLDLRDDDILLAGWDLPFKADTECGGVFAGNACFNLVGDPAAIRECLETKAVFPISDAAKAKVLVTRLPRTKCDDSEMVLLYPDIETRHAVINRIKTAIS